MYNKLPNLVLGFHGCHKDTYKNVITKCGSLKASTNTYDWLGNGIYFWENNYTRASEWASDRYGNDGAVIGAVIDLGYCLNLTDYASSFVLKEGYNILKFQCELNNTEIPKNKKPANTNDLLLRDLDCAVIQQIHDVNRKLGRDAYDSVRGIFTEGEPVYPGAGIFEKTHVQICVCNPNCIKGYFTPLTKDDNYPAP